MNINRELRRIFALLAGIFCLFKLIEKIEFDEKQEDGFQIHEFDDIW